MGGGGLSAGVIWEEKEKMGQLGLKMREAYFQRGEGGENVGSRTIYRFWNIKYRCGGSLLAHRLLSCSPGFISGISPAYRRLSVSS